MGYDHRIDTKELPTQLMAPVNGVAGLQVVVGTAPVNRAEDPQTVVNTPVVAYSFPEAMRLLGYSDDYKNYTLCQSMDASFRLFAVAPVVFINVLDPKKHKKSYSNQDVRVEARKAEIAATGIFLNTMKVIVGESTELERDKDYLAGFTDAGGVEITLLTTEKTDAANSLKVEAEQLDPAMVNAEDIIGGYDAATGRESGLEVIRQVYPKLGLVPGILLAPGWSEDPIVAGVLAAKTESINGVYTCEAAIDMDTENARVYTELKTTKEELAVTSSHAILLWPRLKIGDKTYAYSAVWAAMTAYIDAENNDVPKKSPSNELLHISAAILADGTEVLLDSAQAELVNSYGIVTAINDNGWKAWGNNTAAYPATTDPKDRWIACRRMMSWYRNHFILTFKEKVDDPAEPRLIESVVDSENLYLNSLTQTGDIAGGNIEFNEKENPTSSILNGKIVFHTRIAFWIPAEYILNEIEFDPMILQSALGGA